MIGFPLAYAGVEVRAMCGEGRSALQSWWEFGLQEVVGYYIQ